MRKYGRVDSNHGQIVAALRKAGAVVTSMASLGQGCADILVSYHGNWYVMEIKAPGGALTPDEKAWIASQDGDVWIIHSEAEALGAIRAI